MIFNWFFLFPCIFFLSAVKRDFFFNYTSEKLI